VLTIPGEIRAARTAAAASVRILQAVNAAMEILVFEIDSSRYGLPLASVREIVRAVAPAHLPGAPEVVEGVINYRGTVVPVFDLRSRFGHAAKPLEPNDHLIVATAGDALVAVRADRASWPVAVEAADIEALVSLAASAYVSAVCRLPDDLVLIHDLQTFLSASESLELQEALAQGAAADG
jgi:purine-binding chemotaxis protein CheW